MKYLTSIAAVLTTLAFPLFGQEAENANMFENYTGIFNHGVLALQIQLDRRNLSCNCIDGFWGAKTEIAFRTWQKLTGREETGIPDNEMLEALGGTNDLFRTVEITQTDFDALTQIPSDAEEKSKLVKLDYSTIAEKLSESGHCSERLLFRLNPHCVWPNPPVGSKITIPDCKTVGEHRHAGSVAISLSRMEISVFGVQGEFIALFPCSIALKKSQRPSGTLEIITTVPNPKYLYDWQLFHPGSDIRKKFFLPSGPNSPVGTVWIGLNRIGYGIHGTPTPDRIGEAASHGCFRLSNWNAEKMLALVSSGTPVFISE